MARVEVGAQEFGSIIRNGQPVPNATVQIATLAGPAATHWSAVTGGSSSTANLSTDVDGVVGLAGAARFVDEGTYNLTSGGTTRRVEAVSGATLVSAESRVATGYLTLSSQGCTLDGTTDDTAAFLAAIIKADSESKQLVHDGGNLKLADQIAGRYNFQLRGVDPEKCIITQAEYAAGPLIDLGGYSTSTTNPQSLTADAVKGSRTVVVADASGYAAGDRLLLTSTSLWQWTDKADTYRGEIVTIGSKASNTLTLTAPLDDNYATANAAATKKLLVTENFLLEGVTIRNGAPATHDEGMLRLRGFVAPVIRHVIFDGADNYQILLNCCDDFTVDDARFLNGNDNATAGRYVYGVAAYGATRGGRVSNSFMRGGRHLFTTLGGDGVEGIPRHITVAHCQGTEMTNACFDAHPEGELIHFIDCHAYRTRAWGFQMRAPNSDAVGCSVYENVGAAFWMRDDKQQLVACTSRYSRNGTIFSVAGDPGTTYAGNSFRIDSGPTIQPDQCKLISCVGEDADEDGLYIGGSCDQHQVDLLTIRRPGRSGSNNNGVRFSGTSNGHRFLKPRIENAANGFFGTSSATDVQIDGPEYATVTTPVAGGMVPNFLRDRDNGQAGVLAPSVHGWAEGGLALSANTAYLARFVPSRDIAVALIAFAVTTAAGADDACDVGIYDSTLTRVVSSGATTGKLNSTGVKTVTVTTTVLKAGKTYYAAISCGTLGGTAATIRGANLGSTEGGQLFGGGAGVAEGFTKGTSHPLPAGPIATPTNTSQPPKLAVRES